MFKFRLIILCVALLSGNAAMAMAVKFAFQAPVTIETRNDLLATPEQQFFSEGSVISGSFSYDPSAAAGTVLPNSTFYPFPAFADLSGTIEGNSFSDPGGAVGVFNDTFDTDPVDPNNALVDFLILVSAPQNSPPNLSGFQVINGATTFELFNVRLFWIENTTDFYNDESLPGSLPPGDGATARISLDFRDVTNPDNIHRVFGEPLSVSVVPVPAALWLFPGAIAMLGWVGRRRGQNPR